MLEREGALGSRAAELGDPPGEARPAVRGDERLDPIEFLSPVAAGYQPRTERSSSGRPGGAGASSGTSSSKRWTASPDLGRHEAPSRLPRRRRRPAPGQVPARARRSTGRSSGRTERARCTTAAARRAAVGSRAASAPASSRPGPGAPAGPPRRARAASLASSGSVRQGREDVRSDPEDEARLATLELERLLPAAATLSFASRRSRTQPIGVSRSAVRSRSIAPDTTSRSIARVIAT